MALTRKFMDEVIGPNNILHKSKRWKMHPIRTSFLFSIFTLLLWKYLEDFGLAINIATFILLMPNIALMIKSNEELITSRKIRENRDFRVAKNFALIVGNFHSACQEFDHKKMVAFHNQLSVFRNNEFDTVFQNDLYYSVLNKILINVDDIYIGSSMNKDLFESYFNQGPSLMKLFSPHRSFETLVDEIEETIRINPEDKTFWLGEFENRANMDWVMNMLKQRSQQRDVEKANKFCKEYDAKCEELWNNLSSLYKIIHPS